MLTLPSGVGESGADMEGPDQACSTLGRQMMLPLHKGGLGLRMQSDEGSDAAFVAGTGQTERDPMTPQHFALCNRHVAPRRGSPLNTSTDNARAKQMGRRSKGPANGAPCQKARAASGAAARDEEGR